VNWVDDDGTRKGRLPIDPDRGHSSGARQSTSDQHTGPRAGDRGNAGRGQGAYDKDNPKYPAQNERLGAPDRRAGTEPYGGQRSGTGDRRRCDLGRGARNAAIAVGGTAAAVGTGYAVYQGVKALVAVFGAPETGGASLALLAVP